MKLERCRVLRLGAPLALAVAAAVACGRDDRAASRPAVDPELEAVSSVTTIYGQQADTAFPLMTIDAAVDAPRPPDSWVPEPGSTFRLGTTGFRHVEPSPEGDWIAWESAGVHDLLGVVPADGSGLPVVLDFFFGSAARQLTWAPAGHFLAAHYTAPSGLDELRLYDVLARRRLEGPWTADCVPADRCQVVAHEWNGPTTVQIRTRTPGASERRYQVDVATLPQADR